MKLKCRCGKEAVFEAIFETDRYIVIPKTYYCSNCMEDMTEINGFPRYKQKLIRSKNEK